MKKIFFFLLLTICSLHSMDVMGKIERTERKKVGEKGLLYLSFFLKDVVIEVKRKNGNTEEELVKIINGFHSSSESLRYTLYIKNGKSLIPSHKYLSQKTD